MSVKKRKAAESDLVETETTAKAATPAAFWGEQQCQRCSNKAYYCVGGSNVLLCGVHSRSAQQRTELLKNPNAAQVEEERLRSWQRLVERTAAENRAAGRRGALTCSKLRMMRQPDHVDGVLNVFPNNKHQNRKDGFGCASLSPMRLGPVAHQQPGVPEALSIENYHQFNKVFERETKKEAGIVSVLPSFYQLRDRAYRDATPHRHKFEDEKGVGGNKNVPLFSIHLTAAGQERRYTYLQSRYFYCHQYELLAKQQPDFATLKQMLADGTNLQIVGYDGYPVTRSLWEHYNDTSRPFGHELVLFSLLLLENPAEYPWNRFYALNRALYEDVPPAAEDVASGATLVPDGAPRDDDGEGEEQGEEEKEDEEESDDDASVDPE